jgi:hypothetical protein
MEEGGQALRETPVVMVVLIILLRIQKQITIAAVDISNSDYTDPMVIVWAKTLAKMELVLRVAEKQLLCCMKAEAHRRQKG